MVLSKGELNRYSRHLLLPEVGVDGQQKLKDASVLIVGLGGLGSPLSMYLAASGVGTLGLVDYDTVECSNLQRQIIHETPDVGRLKIDSATDTLREINPEVTIVRHNVRLTSKNALEIINNYDIVADGTDNFQTRYLVNDACVLLGKPNVYGSIHKFEGQASVFSTKNGPCYRCLFPNPPESGTIPSCEEAGVLGVLPGLIGTVQATEVVKLILGKGEPLIGRLLLYNGLDMKFSEIKLKVDCNCSICGENPIITELIDYDEFCDIKKKNDQLPKSKPMVAKRWEDESEMHPLVLSKLIEQRHDLFLLDVREPYEFEICNIEESVLMPLNQLPYKLNSLPKNKMIVVICHHGMRSGNAMDYLLDNDFKNVYNLKGGIDNYAIEVNPDLDRY